MGAPLVVEKPSADRKDIKTSNVNHTDDANGSFLAPSENCREAADLLLFSAVYCCCNRMWSTLSMVVKSLFVDVVFQIDAYQSTRIVNKCIEGSSLAHPIISSF